MNNRSHVPVYKVLLVGDANVGKSSLIRRALVDEIEVNYTPTVGVDLSGLAIIIDGEQPVLLTAIDLGGQEDFTVLRTMYYRGAHYALLVFDVTQCESFSHLKRWYQGLQTSIVRTENRTLPVAVVANKIDLEDKRCVTTEEAKTYAGTINGSYFETSAKTGVNVKELFQSVAAYLYRQYHRPPIAT